jgi:acyl-CoA thioester hydrolase
MTPDLLITHRIVVRFSDCDPLGHVNNARYLTYLEEARIHLWRRQAGLELRIAAGSGGQAGEGFILARTEIDFLSPAHDGDELDVRLTLDAIGRKSMTYGYAIVDVKTGRPVASAKSVVVWYDYAAGRSIPLSDKTKALLSRAV